MVLAVASAVVSLATPMPPVFHRISQCETGGNPRHATRDYISQYGIYRPAWNEYRPRWVKAVATRGFKGERLPSVAEQNAVALSIARRAGLTAWSCYRHQRSVRNG